MPVAKGWSRALPETLDCVVRLGPLRTSMVAAYLDIETQAAMKRLERLREMGKVTSEVHHNNGRYCIWSAVDAVPVR